MSKSSRKKPSTKPYTKDEYFQARNLVTKIEVREACEQHRFDDLEDVLFAHGKFLERHPEADKTV